MSDLFKTVTRRLAKWGYEAVWLAEMAFKKPVFNCQECGQCILQHTGMVCPMNCPKQMRNGPCGGPIGDRCEVYPDRPCVWLKIGDFSRQLGWMNRLEKLQGPVDWSLQGSSAWINLFQGKATPIPLSEKPRSAPRQIRAGSRLELTLAAGHFAVTAELSPPKSANAAIVRKKADAMLGYVDGCNVTDNQRGVAHLSSFAACLIAMERGLEPVLQISCRDRNRLAIQSDLLGAAAVGMKNVLLLTGDHMVYGDQPNAKPVYDLDSVSALGVARRMRDEAKFLNGVAIKTPPKLFLGGAFHPGLDPIDLQILRTEKKIRAGADYFQGQAIYDVKRFREYMRRIVDRGLHERAYFLPGILLFKSPKVAQFLREKVPGVNLPDDIYHRMMQAKDPEEEGIRIGVELVEAFRETPGVHGVHLMAVNWEESYPEVLRRCGLYPRPALTAEVSALATTNA